MEIFYTVVIAILIMGGWALTIGGITSFIQAASDAVIYYKSVDAQTASEKEMLQYIITNAKNIGICIWFALIAIAVPGALLNVAKFLIHEHPIQNIIFNTVNPATIITTVLTIILSIIMVKSLNRMAREMTSNVNHYETIEEFRVNKLREESKYRNQQLPH